LLLHAHNAVFYFIFQKKTLDASARRPIATANLKNVDPKLAEMILNELVENGAPVTFADIG
jgi:hypothetical protein